MKGSEMRITLLMICALLVSATFAAAEDARPIGLVKTTSGEAFILRDGRRLAAHPGLDLMLGDQLSTGSSGTLGVILRDDTVISLGPATLTRLEQFAFDPVQGNLGLVLRVTRGLIEYLSGKISKLAPGSVRIETPVATLGIRGTRLLARIEP
jgi:hypothetical protein